MENFKELLQGVRNNNKYSVWFQARSIEEHTVGLVEEVEEIRAALKNNDIDNLEEELGDALWDTMCLISIAERDHGLDFDNIVKRVVDKFKQRKPHIFEGKVLNLDEEVKVWFEAKGKEKGKVIIQNERI